MSNLLRYGERLVCPITLTPAPASNASRAEVEGKLTSAPLTRGTGLAARGKMAIVMSVGVKGGKMAMVGRW